MRFFYFTLNDFYKLTICCFSHYYHPSLKGSVAEMIVEEPERISGQSTIRVSHRVIFIIFYFFFYFRFQSFFVFFLYENLELKFVCLTVFCPFTVACQTTLSLPLTFNLEKVLGEPMMPLIRTHWIQTIKPFMSHTCPLSIS